MLKHNINDIETALAPLLALIAALREAELHTVDPSDASDASDASLDIPGVLERFLEPEIQETLPEALRPFANAYLKSLPGYGQGDRQRASEQHALRLDLWRGDAQEVDEADIQALGLQEERLN
jgi:hypothetical protein